MALLPENTNKAKHFQRYIHAYYTVFAFMLSGANFDQDLTNGWQGVCICWVQGSFPHLASWNWIPEDGKLHWFAQIYIYDTDAQVNY